MLIPLADRVELPAGNYFISDLMGCTVFELPEGMTKLASPACAAEEAPRVLGTVRDVFFPEKALPARRCFKWKLPLAKC